MKKIKLALCTTFASIMLSIWLLTAAPVQAGIKSGADCNAANLTQALLGIGTSQSGIVNNATIPLFVVCSVDFDFLEGLFDVVVEAVFPPGGGSILCTYRSAPFGVPGFVFFNFTIVSGFDATAPGPISPLRGVDSVVTENGPAGFPIPVGAGPNNTVVCALDPGEGISAVFF